MVDKPNPTRTFDMLLCALFPMAVVFATLPFAEMGINDDFSYSQTALHLASTGKLVYNGWSSAMLGFQAYWGALFIKLFGFSFFILRISTLLFAVGCAVLLYLLSTDAGMARSRAIFLTFFVISSPLALPVEASFMTDIPGLFFQLFCFFALLRATDPQASQPKIVFWTIILTAAGLAGGTIRQYNSDLYAFGLDKVIPIC
jgi:hypothetical protein